MKPTRIAALLIAAVLCGALGAIFDPATGGPATSAGSPAAAGSVTNKTRGRAYLFRGFVGMVFSRGTDRLAERIEKAGFVASANEAVMCSSVAEEAVRDYRRDPAPIVLIGHSVGGACAVSFASTLKAENIPVSLLVTSDPARVTGDVPPNVERYINIFQSDSLLGGVNIDPAPGFRGHYASYDLAEHAEIKHVNMDKTETVQDQLVIKVQQLSAVPKTDSETVPIRYVVPADAAIELWDSGMPVFARADDTLQTLAMLYHVPKWSISQINRLPEGGSLTAGQRVVVPRYLAPLGAPEGGAVSAQAPPKR
jgi:thioesterase domain-containing protein